MNMSKQKNQFKALRRQAGFTMMELLVAVLVMGVGVLGVTGLQLVSLQNNQAALLRGEAVQLAYDVLDRIRVNPGAGVAGIAYDGVDIGDDPAAPNDCIANNCATAQMTAFDVAVWKCSLGGYNTEETCEDLRDTDALPTDLEQPGLPNGDGSIEVDANGIITVTVQWNGFNNQLQTISISSQG
ncbi:MAG: type IV pilus modification protein PilV [Pseudomonadales bacterium]|nr:type IV pilus modification protein PilV [Pseudomonadales bacterium]